MMMKTIGERMKCYEKRRRMKKKKKKKEKRKGRDEIEKDVDDKVMI